MWCTHYTMRLRVVPCSDGEPWIVLICSQAVQMICALPQLILSSRKSSRSSAVLDGSSCRVAARTAQQAAKQVAEGAAPPLAVAAAKAAIKGTLPPLAIALRAKAAAESAAEAAATRPSLPHCPYRQHERDQLRPPSRSRKPCNYHHRQPRVRPSARKRRRRRESRRHMDRAGALRVALAHDARPLEHLGELARDVAGLTPALWQAVHIRACAPIERHRVRAKCHGLLT